MIHYESMESLSYLIYSSQAILSHHSVPELTSSELYRFKPNFENLTGLLAFRKGFFLQYIEGEQKFLNESYRLLRLNRQHHTVRILSQGPLAHRLFTNWTAHSVITSHHGPSSESLIDLFEMVLNSKSPQGSEIALILKKFCQNATITPETYITV